MALSHRLLAIDDAARCLLRRRETDVYLVTMQQSGTHWLKMMVSYYLCNYYGVEYSFDSVNVNDIIPHAKDDIKLKIDGGPKIRQAHHSYWFLFRGKKVILVVRDLREALMSAYDKMVKINGDVVSFGEFLRGDFNGSDLDYVTASLERRVRFLNRWGDSLNKLGGFYIIKYEDIKRDAGRVLCGVMDFIGCDVDNELVKRAVRFCRKENMNRLSRSTGGSHRYAVSDKEKRDKSEYFDGGDVDWFVDYVKRELDNDFGYKYV